MAEVKPFRAVRYDPRRAGALETLVAPPYDVLSPEQRAAYRARSPHNVVHLTLPDDEGRAAELWRTWLDERILVREHEPSLWWLAQDYVGPDGVARRRDGLVCALRARPYGEGGVLPHERTHAGPKEGRLRLLRALRAHVEPIFVLYDGSLDAPGGDPDFDVTLEAVRSRLWRIGGDPPGELADATFLIADGHHRYETAVAFHEEEGTEASAWLLAVVVPTQQEGLTIFPTHRVVQRLPDHSADGDGDLDEALRRLATEPEERAAAVLYREGRASIVEGDEGEVDAHLVDRFAPEGVTYTPSVEDAVAAVDAGDAEAAFLLRPPSVEQVATVARAGKTMPQKSTYFFPKLPSGLIFLPLE